jgi:hypothetical protein
MLEHYPVGESMLKTIALGFLVGVAVVVTCHVLNGW